MSTLLALLLTAGAWDAFVMHDASPRYLTLHEVQQAARRGALPAGQRVVLAVSQPAPQLQAVAAHVEAGSLFCIQHAALPGLPAGVWQCEVRSDRRLWPVVIPSPNVVPSLPAPTFSCAAGACREFLPTP